MNFVPDTKSKNQEIPFFEDVSSESGWAGQTTGKSEDILKAEISLAIGLLGGLVYKWIPGTFGNRYGYRILFNMESGGSGRIDVLALPLKTPSSHRGFEEKKKQALKMALFNIRDQLQSMWRMEKLVPGYFGLMPMMLIDGVKTAGEAWYSSEVWYSHLKLSEPEIMEGDFEKDS